MSYDWPSKEADRPLFPLRTVGQVRALFESHLARPEPDLALLSIVAGFVENTLTAATSITTSESSDVGNGGDNCVDSDVTSVNLPLDPHVSWDTVDTLMTKFNATVRGFCDPELLSAVIKPASDVGDKKVERLSLRKRKLIKHIADIVWNTLTKSQYKDRPHLQSIYSYLTGNKLDCFGVAYAVVAALQLLEVSDVHLAVSEDHAWVVFQGDEEGEVETAEVTWHGKGTEDKRGQPVEPLKAKTSWLYVAGRPTLCDRAMEVAAMVSAINPAVNSGVDSMEVGAVQQELLWLLYDSGHLKKYPLAIGNLADLEEITPTIGRPNCSQLYEESVQSNTKHYSNHHVYPHTYQGGYFYRHKRYKKAIEAWANAATVMKLYNYSKEDEEIYKEFMEIANDFLPHIVKSQALPTDASSTTASQGAVSEENSSDPANGAATIPDTPTLLKDPEAFSNVLRFYDGLCSWEEGSATPILHIGWAKPMVATLSKFDPSVRQKVAGVTDDSSDEDEDDEDKDKKGNQSCSGMSPSLPPLVPKLSPEPSPVITSSPHPSLGHGGSPATNVSPISSMSAGSNSTMNMSCIDPECFQKIEDVSSTSAPSFQVFLCKLFQKDSNNQISKQPIIEKSSSKAPVEEDLKIELFSAKMKGMQELFGAGKLNISAIQLQLTAQSNAKEDTGKSSRPKRSRRSFDD